MGYYIRAQAHRKSAPYWKVQYVTYKKSEVINSKAKTPKKTWDVSKDRWSLLGFHKSMTVKEARARASQLNSKLLLKRQEERLQKIKQEERQFKLKTSSIFPEEFLVEFEERFVVARVGESEKDKFKKSGRRFTHWRAAQKMITAVGLDPTEWLYNKIKIYDYFYSKQYSIGYVNGLIAFANLWGVYISRKLNQPFNYIPKPRGYERSRLIESYYSRERPGKRPSKLITPNHLLAIKEKINKPNF